MTLTDQQKQNAADELVKHLDEFFAQGGGHAEVSCINGKTNVKHVSKQYNECADGKGACGIPTELDDEQLNLENE